MTLLSAARLAALAGVTAAEVERLVDLGVVVARGGGEPFLELDVPKVRRAAACEQAGLPMEGIASAIRVGRLSFTFLEAAPFRRWAVRSGRTYRQVSQDTGNPPGDARGGAGVDGVRPGRPRRADAGGRAGGGAAAAAGPGQRDLRPGLAGPARPGACGGPAADRHGLGRGNDANHLELIRAWFGGPLGELPPADADAYFGKVLRDAKPSRAPGRAAAPTGFFQLLELRHKVTCRYPLEGRVGSPCACLRSSAEQAAGR